MGEKALNVADDLSRPVLEARHITRNYGAVIALADASISLFPNEVLGLSATTVPASPHS
jgi:ABC-type phosphonate transport system ATPase subunit